jgi:hypothetical protein
MLCAGAEARARVRASASAVPMRTRAERANPCGHVVRARTRVGERWRAQCGAMWRRRAATRCTAHAPAACTRPIACPPRPARAPRCVREPPSPVRTHLQVAAGYAAAPAPPPAQAPAASRAATTMRSAPAPAAPPAEAATTRAAFGKRLLVCRVRTRTHARSALLSFWDVARRIRRHHARGAAPRRGAPGRPCSGRGERRGFFAALRMRERETRCCV